MTPKSGIDGRSILRTSKRHPEPEVLCIGETMAMVTSTDASPVASAETFSISAGGAESNLAQYLAEFGVPVVWISALGADPLGDRVERSIAASGVDTQWVSRDPDANTGLYLKDPGGNAHYYRQGSAASRMGPESIADWPLANASWIHLSGITPALSASCHALVHAVLDAAHRADTPVSFDVNYRPALWPAAKAAETVQPLASRADVVLVGRDEAEVLWGTKSAEEVAAVFPQVRRVVVKDGDVEAVEFDRTGPRDIVTRVAARRVEVVEVVGAGDAFGAGYLAALFRGDPAEERLALGHSLAAWVIGSAADHRPGHGPIVHAPFSSGDTS